jgi:hypothetical protein
MAYEPEEDHIEGDEEVEETPSKPAKAPKKSSLPLAPEDWEMGLPGGGAPLPGALPSPSFQLPPAAPAPSAPASMPPGLAGVMGLPPPVAAPPTRKPDRLPYLP